MIFAEVDNGNNEIAYLLTALGAMVTVVGVFWKMISKNHSETKVRCEVLDNKLHETKDNLVTMSERMGNLEGRVKFAEEIGPAIKNVEGMVSELLTEIKNEHE